MQSKHCILLYGLPKFNMLTQACKLGRKHATCMLTMWMTFDALSQSFDTKDLRFTELAHNEHCDSLAVTIHSEEVLQCDDPLN